MKRISLFFIYLLLLVLISPAQEISRQEADSSLLKLNKTKKDTDRIELLLALAQFHIFKPGENKIDLDSAAIYINEAKSLGTNIENANAYGYLILTQSILMKERNVKPDGPTFYRSEPTKKMAEQAIKILESGTNKDYLAQAYYELAMYYDFNDKLQLSKKIELIQQSVDAFQQAGNKKRKGRSLEMLGDLYIVDGKIDKALESLKEALVLYNSIDYPKLQGVYVLLGSAYNHQQDYASSLLNLLKALKTAQLEKDTSLQLCQINNNLGDLYRAIDRLDMSLKYLNDAFKIARKYNDESAIYYLALNLSSTYNRLKQSDQSLKILGYIPEKYRFSKNVVQRIAVNTGYLRSYLGLNQLEKAHPYCDVLLGLLDSDNVEADRRARIYMYVADFYFLSKQYSKAHYYLEKSNAIAKKINYDFVQVHNLELAYKMDSVQGNFRSAFNNLHRYKVKADSVSSESKVRQFQLMNVEYEVEMKEDSIKSKDKDISFLKQKTDLQQANLKQAGLVRNLTIAGAILLLILLGLIYNRYLHKQKTNRLLESQKEVIDKSNRELQKLNEQQTKLLVEKDWLVKEIHHRVKNNLQMVVSLLNAQTEFLTHPSAIDAIKESRERMQAIAIIHQKLYQLDNSTQINMRSYINELVDNIRSSFADSERIHFKADVVDVYLDITQSVPLGLILNEAITNAVKYAYPTNKNGLIQISLDHYDTDKLQLKVADNGKGFPADVDIKHSNSLGMQLISLFSEQLEGDLYFINNNGLEVRLNFKSAAYHNSAIDKIVA